MKYETKKIREIRDDNESGDIICIREINQNIKNVFEGKALTRPLRILNRNCEFKKRYKIACDLIEGDTLEELETKQRMKEYMREKYRKENKLTKDRFRV